jgi:hypothetical protein
MDESLDISLWRWGSSATQPAVSTTRSSTAGSSVVAPAVTSTSVALKASYSTPRETSMP